ncbi:MAG: LLM class flavin-dependent oxidoreductase [Deltaproteobacteria bacterium]|nr:LLM class flavin-dependent oxidoreductase [Deltaproteobacteria bacterium]
MKVSLFTEVQCPSGSVPAELLEQFLEQAELADTLGYDGYWIAEIHFTPSFSLLSAPYVVLGAATQRTRNLRLGVAVNTLPVHHPMQLAEQAATLDVLSNGRMCFAAGGGHPHTRAYECFGVEHEHVRALMRESIEVIRLAWTRDAVDYEGRFFQIPGIVANPRPLQQPHPPIYTAASSLDGVNFAARMGLNLFIPVHVRTAEELREFAATYWKALADHGHDPDEHELGLLLPMHVGGTAAEAEARSEAGVMGYYDVIRETRGSYAEWLTARGRPLPERLRRNAAAGGLSFDRVCSEFAAIGTAGRVVDRVGDLARDTGAAHVLAWMNIGSVSHDHIKESMQRFAEDALPAVRAI